MSEEEKKVIRMDHLYHYYEEKHMITEDATDAILSFMAAFLETEAQYENLYRKLEDNE